MDCKSRCVCVCVCDHWLIRVDVVRNCFETFSSSSWLRRINLLLHCCAGLELVSVLWWSWRAEGGLQTTSNDSTMTQNERSCYLLIKPLMASGILQDSHHQEPSVASCLVTACGSACKYRLSICCYLMLFASICIVYKWPHTRGWSQHHRLAVESCKDRYDWSNIELLRRCVKLTLWHDRDSTLE